MFIQRTRSWYSGTEQCAQGTYLIVFNKNRELRALVRRVRLRQLGHFMMGKANIGGEYITLSGPYGRDGLPLSSEDYPYCWEHAVPLPIEVVDKFWAGGGHNDVGDEAPDVQAWALKNLKGLKKRIPIPSETVSWGAGRERILRQWVYCHNEHTSFGYVKAGDLIRFKDGSKEAEAIGRVMGKVASSGKLMVLQLSDNLSYAYIRTVEPKNVTMVGRIPAAMLHWFTQPELPSVTEVMRLSHQGSLTDRYLPKPGEVKDEREVRRDG